MVRQGKVMYIGISDTPAWIVSQANTLAQGHGWTSFIALQIEYSLIERTPERDLLPMAQAFEMAVTPWSPLAGGVLTGKYNHGENKQSSRGGEISERSLKIAEVVVQVAAEVGHSPSQVALAWLLAQGNAMIPIIGASKLSQFKDNLGSIELTLLPEQLHQLHQVSQIELGFPHSFLESDSMRKILFGGTYELIDNPRKFIRNN
jgi:aryl-alcohol dehydrogenase-like predicted oxidoreductase